MISSIALRGLAAGSAAALLIRPATRSDAGWTRRGLGIRRLATKEIIAPDGQQVFGPYSPGLAVGDQIFLSGQVAPDAGDVVAQALAAAVLGGREAAERVERNHVQRRHHDSY